MTHPDLIALETMALVVELGGFSAAAHRLGVKQSTVSYRIERLRRALGDPLFIRHGAGVKPTERCLEAAARAERIFEDLGALLESGRFDPARAEGRFVISCNVYERAMILPSLVGRVRAKAPGMRLTVLPAQTQGAEQLRRGAADLLFSPRLPDHDAFDSTPLFADRYLAAMDAAHPLAAQPLTPQNYGAAAHVVIDYGGGWRSPYLDSAAAIGLEIRPVLTVPSPGELTALIAGTDLVATIPGRFAATLDRRRIALRPVPFDSQIELFAYAAPLSRSSARVAWLIEEARAAASDVAGGE